MLKLLDISAKPAPTSPDQPEDLFWPDKKPKVRIITRRRNEGKKARYLVHFWGQHEIAGTWLTADQLAPGDRTHITDFDRRWAQGLPSKFSPESGVDLSIPPAPRPPTTEAQRDTRR